jgi:hypothetical protein
MHFQNNVTDINHRHLSHHNVDVMQNMMPRGKGVFEWLYLFAA